MEHQRKRHVPRDEGIDYRENKYAAPVGTIWLILAIAGLIAVGFFCVQFTRGLLDNTAEKEKFERFIGPIVMFDPVPFDDPVNADADFLLQSSIWCTMLGDKRESYQYDDLGRLIVPASDVDVTAARVYGQNVKLEHRSFGDFERPNVYDEATKTYYVWVNIQADLYRPSVERVVKKGDQYTLTVGYLPADTVWTRAQAEANSKNKAVADKMLYYDLLKVKDHYQLLAIRYIPVAEAQSGTGQIPGAALQPAASSKGGSSASSASKADKSSSADRSEDENESSSEEEDSDTSGEDSEAENSSEAESDTE